MRCRISSRPSATASSESASASGRFLPRGEQVGGQLVPDLGRAGAILEAPPECRLGPLEVPVAGVADPEVRVRLPPVGGLVYDLLVGRHRLGVAAEHVEGVGPEGARAALLHLVGGGLHGLLEELEGLGVVRGVEEGEAGVYEHVGVLGQRSVQRSKVAFASAGSPMKP